MQLVIEADTRPVDDLLGDLVDKLEHPRVLLQLLGRRLEDYEAEQFRTAGHGSWPALSPVTVMLKGGGRVLVDSGDLMQHLTTARYDGDDRVYVAGPAYARFHRTGTQKMPRRDPDPAPDGRTVESWSDDVLDYLLDGHR